MQGNGETRIGKPKQNQQNEGTRVTENIKKRRKQNKDDREEVSEDKKKITKRKVKRIIKITIKNKTDKRRKKYKETKINACTVLNDKEEKSSLTNKRKKV